MDLDLNYNYVFFLENLIFKIDLHLNVNVINKL